MTEPEAGSPDVDRFLRDKIDTVPHLEALLLLWNSRPQVWSIEDLSKGLYLSGHAARAILADLVRLWLIANVQGSSENYRYESEPERDQLITAVDATYRRELIRVTRLIHSNASSAIREFARAFRLKKEGD